MLLNYLDKLRAKPPPGGGGPGGRLGGGGGGGGGLRGVLVGGRLNGRRLFCMAYHAAVPFLGLLVLASGECVSGRTEGNGEHVLSTLAGYPHFGGIVR